MENDEIIENNRNYWNDHADLWFGTTALPEFGVRFPTEDDLHLFAERLHVLDGQVLDLPSFEQDFSGRRFM